MKSAIVSFFLALALCPFGLVVGQPVSAVVSPNPVNSGSPVTITITPKVAISLPSSCNINTIRQGSPTGPIIFSPFCLSVITSVAACQQRSETWQGLDPAGAGYPPGDYWIEVRYWDPAFTTITSSFFPFTIQANAQEPTLAALTPAAIGQPLVLTVNAPLFPGGAYITACSFTTDTGGLIAPGEYLALDFDLLFGLSFPNPHPGLFAGLQGNLDATGFTNAPTMFVPNIPALQCTGIAFQAAVFSASVELTNGLSFTIQ